MLKSIMGGPSNDGNRRTSEPGRLDEKQQASLVERCGDDHDLGMVIGAASDLGACMSQLRHPHVVMGAQLHMYAWQLLFCCCMCACTPCTQQAAASDTILSFCTWSG